MRHNGAEIIIKLLEREGITIVSGIPGGANLPLYDALSRSPIRHVLARHEQGAGFIAHGMARSTGKTAVCFATSGPGVTNLVTALADAEARLRTHRRHYGPGRHVHDRDRCLSGSGYPWCRRVGQTGI